jgi:hypothetical protein
MNKQQLEEQADLILEKIGAAQHFESLNQTYNFSNLSLKNIWHLRWQSFFQNSDLPIRLYGTNGFMIRSLSLVNRLYREKIPNIETADRATALLIADMCRKKRFFFKTENLFTKYMQCLEQEAIEAGKKGVPYLDPTTLQRIRSDLGALKATRTQ